MIFHGVRHPTAMGAVATNLPIGQNWKLQIRLDKYRVGRGTPSAPRWGQKPGPVRSLLNLVGGRRLVVGVADLFIGPAVIEPPQDGGVPFFPFLALASSKALFS